MKNKHALYYPNNPTAPSGNPSYGMADFRMVFVVSPSNGTVIMTAWIWCNDRIEWRCANFKELPDWARSVMEEMGIDPRFTTLSLSTANGKRLWDGFRKEGWQW